MESGYSIILAAKLILALSYFYLPTLVLRTMLVGGGVNSAIELYGKFFVDVYKLYSINIVYFNISFSSTNTIKLITIYLYSTNHGTEIPKTSSVTQENY